jgi:DNA-binding MurR/RpiR family transcriptional regulator
VIYYPISKIVDATEVSKATIVRFAQYLGYQGFNEFRDSLFDYYRENLSPESRMKRSIETVKNGEDTYERIAEREIQYIRTSMKTINEETFREAVETICSAETLYIVAPGANEHLASYLNFRLRRLKFNCRQVSAAGRDICEHFLLLKQGDVAVVYNFSRPSTDFIRVMNLLKDSAIPTILVTDMRTPAMTRLATYVLYAERGPSGTFPSPVVPMTITFSLLMSIEEKLKDKAVEALKSLGRLRNEYYYTDRFSG